MRVFSDTKFQSMLFKLISLWKSLWATHLIWQGHCCGLKSSPEMQAVLYPSLNHSHRWLIVTQLPVFFPFQGTPLSPTCCSPSRVRLKQRTMRSSAHDVSEGSWWSWLFASYWYYLILSVNQDRTKPFPGPNHCCLQAFKKPVPQKSRNAHEKHGTPNGTPGSQEILDSGEGVRADRIFFWSMDDCEYQPQYCRAGWIFLMSNRVTSDISCVFSSWK